MYFQITFVTIEPPNIRKAEAVNPQISHPASPLPLQCSSAPQIPSPMSDTAQGSRPPAPNPVKNIATPTSIARHGHESSQIAQPSTFLSPAQNRAMQDKPLSTVDKDQQSGLVSGALSRRITILLSARGRRRWETDFGFLVESAEADILGSCRRRSGTSSRSGQATMSSRSPFDLLYSTRICL